MQGTAWASRELGGVTPEVKKRKKKLLSIYSMITQYIQKIISGSFGLSWQNEHRIDLWGQLSQVYMLQLQ